MIVKIACAQVKKLSMSKGCACTALTFVSNSCDSKGERV